MRGYLERLGRDNRRRVEIRDVAVICSDAVDENASERPFRAPVKPSRGRDTQICAKRLRLRDPSKRLRSARGALL